MNKHKESVAKRRAEGQGSKANTDSWLSEKIIIAGIGGWNF